MKVECPKCGVEIKAPRYVRSGFQIDVKHPELGNIVIGNCAICGEKFGVSTLTGKVKSVTDKDLKDLKLMDRQNLLVKYAGIHPTAMMNNVWEQCRAIIVKVNMIKNPKELNEVEGDMDIFIDDLHSIVSTRSPDFYDKMMTMTTQKIIVDIVKRIKLYNEWLCNDLPSTDGSLERRRMMEQFNQIFDEITTLKKGEVYEKRSK